MIKSGRCYGSLKRPTTDIQNSGYQVSIVLVVTGMRNRYIKNYLSEADSSPRNFRTIRSDQFGIYNNTYDYYQIFNLKNLLPGNSKSGDKERLVFMVRN